MNNATYINEHIHDRYPFIAGVAVPFPDKIIVGLKLCVLPSCTNVYISSVNIAENYVEVTVCATVKTTDNTTGIETETEYVLGYIRGGREQRCYSESPERPMSGFLFVGQVDAGDTGVYNGKFMLDPSCMVVMPLAVYCRYPTLWINGDFFKINRMLEIRAVGLFDVTETDAGPCITLATDAKNAHLVLWDNEYAYTKVNTINSYSATTLNIATSGNVSVHGSTTSNGAVVADVVLTGGKEFPHCYDRNLDASENEMEG